MPAFELKMRSKSKGDFEAAWVDDAACLWNDERLGSPKPLVAEWEPPKLQLHWPEAGPTAVLFNPHAIAVSGDLRQDLSAFRELEFLPIQVADCGTYYILHVIEAMELPAGTSARMAPPPSGNLVELHSFPSDFDPRLAFFRILQPEGSAARRMVRTTRAIYVGSVGYDAITRVASQFFELRKKCR